MFVKPVWITIRSTDGVGSILRKLKSRKSIFILKQNRFEVIYRGTLYIFATKSHMFRRCFSDWPWKFAHEIRADMFFTSVDVCGVPERRECTLLFFDRDIRGARKSNTLKNQTSTAERRENKRWYVPPSIHPSTRATLVVALLTCSKRRGFFTRSRPNLFSMFRFLFFT